MKIVKRTKTIVIPHNASGMFLGTRVDYEYLFSLPWIYIRACYECGNREFLLRKKGFIPTKKIITKYKHKKENGTP